MTGQAERAYLVELLLWLSEPQMPVPRPDLSPYPSAHLPLDVSSHVPQSTLACSYLCTPFYPLLLSSAIQPLFPCPPLVPFLQGAFRDYFSPQGSLPS